MGMNQPASAKCGSDAAAGCQRVLTPQRQWSTRIHEFESKCSPAARDKRQLPTQEPTVALFFTTGMKNNDQSEPLNTLDTSTTVQAGD
jgi:hypothetical protein